MTKSLPLVFDAPRRGKPPTHLADLDPAARERAVVAAGHPGFRARQLTRHYFANLTRDPDAMTDLPAATRQALATTFLPELLTEVRSVACDDGATRKTLWRAHDGTLIESVLMRYPDRVTLCVSSQAGCGMACPFCATGQGGLQRNLSAAEIVEQVRLAALAAREGRLGDGQGLSNEPLADSRRLSNEPLADSRRLSNEPLADSRRLSNEPLADSRRLSNVVFMGMGEPLANYARVLAAVKMISAPAPDGLGISARSITVSTVGLVPGIEHLTAEKLPVRLAVSLHTPDDELRDTLVPVNQRWAVADVLRAARGYADATGRRVSIEYALIREVNDQPWRADLLGRLLREHLGQLVHVNLIPLNPTPGSQWDASPKPVQDEFVRRVRAAGVACTVRDTRGREIAAACGQLAAEGV